jgi:Protein of unknown function (Gmx_para_CXXCG)
MDLSAQRRLTSGSGGDAGHGPSAPFWRLQQPEYDSDHADTYINGALDHPFALPGVKCERCGQTWGGTAIVPYELPPDLQSVQQLRNGWPISGREHAKLRRRVLEALRAAGAPIAELRVGATFQPAYLDVPSRPEADFLWSGLGSVVVSQRVHDTMARAAVSGCEFVRVIPRKIGGRRATRRPLIPSGGEPEDLLAQVAPIRDPSEIPPYYELVVTAQSKHPPGAEPEATCELCGRETYDADARRLVMEPHMWNGQDVFFLATTLWIIVTDRVKALLEPLRPTNVSFGAMASAE